MNIEKILENLTSICKNTNENIQGNCYTLDQQYVTPKFYKPKRENLALLSYKCNTILEIGFNAGHSAAVMLSANPHLKLTCVDIATHSYLDQCYDYLCSLFPGRIKLLKTDSNKIHNFMGNEFYKTFDALHIDGHHEDEVFMYDTIGYLRYLKDNALVVMDDTQYYDINLWCESMITTPLFTEVKYDDSTPLQFKTTTVHTHRIFNFNRNKIGICTLPVDSKTLRFTADSLKQWTSKYNVDLLTDEKLIDRQRPISWSKVKIISHYMDQGYDYIFWINPNILINNMDISPEDFLTLFKKDKHLLTSFTNSLFTDMFIIKNSDLSKRFLEKVYETGDLETENYEAFHFSKHLKSFPWNNIQQIIPYEYRSLFNTSFQSNNLSDYSNIFSLKFENTVTSCPDIKKNDSDSTLTYKFFSGYYTLIKNIDYVVKKFLNNRDLVQNDFEYTENSFLWFNGYYKDSFLVFLAKNSQNNMDIMIIRFDEQRLWGNNLMIKVYDKDHTNSEIIQIGSNNSFIKYIQNIELKNITLH